MNQCKLTECLGKQRCRHCMAMDMRYRTPEEAVREALEQEVSELRVLLKRLLDSREKEARTSEDDHLRSMIEASAAEKDAREYLTPNSLSPARASSAVLMNDGNDT